MFRDRTRIKLRAGAGGSGKIAFGAHYLPTGGTGGNGGGFYFEGSNSVYDLSFLNYNALYSAENGEAGGVKNLTGRNGKDLILKVPLTTRVYGPGRKELLSITEHGEKKLLLKGGVGGLGNAYYKRYGISASRNSQPGKPGESLSVTLELELQSDVIFIGLPNAGKSSILNSLTGANSEVAAYAFTTINPVLGRMEKITLMDLPGLIERTSEGKGLGTDFVKHTRSARLIAHFVSLDSDDPIRDYETVRKELENIGEELAGKPEVIILSKADTVRSADLPAITKLFKKYKKPVVTVSVYDLDAISKLKEVLASMLAT